MNNEVKELAGEISAALIFWRRIQELKLGEGHLGVVLCQNQATPGKVVALKIHSTAHDVSTKEQFDKFFEVYSKEKELIEGTGETEGIA